MKRYQVIPVSSNVEKIYPSETIVTVEEKICKAMADQLTTISEQRLISKIGEISKIELKEVEKIIKIQLDLE